MSKPLWQHAIDVLDQLAQQRSADNRIRPVSSTELLAALGQSPNAGKNLGNVVALLDAVCLIADLPWIGRLVIFQNAAPDFFGPWAPFRKYIVESGPQTRRWTDADLKRVRNSLESSPPTDPNSWWQERKEHAETDVLRAVLVVLDEVCSHQ